MINKMLMINMLHIYLRQHKLYHQKHINSLHLHFSIHSKLFLLIYLYKVLIYKCLKLHLMHLHPKHMLHQLYHHHFNKHKFLYTHCNLIVQYNLYHLMYMLIILININIQFLIVYLYILYLYIFMY